jgi:hypothetical protein
LILQAVIGEIESGVEHLRTQFPERDGAAEPWPNVVQEVFTFFLAHQYDRALVSAQRLDRVPPLSAERLSYWQTLLTNIEPWDGWNEDLMQVLRYTLCPLGDYVSQTWPYEYGSWTTVVMHRETHGRRVSNTHPTKTKVMHMCLFALKLVKTVAAFARHEVQRVHNHTQLFPEPQPFLEDWCIGCVAMCNALHHLIFMQFLHNMVCCRMMQPHPPLTRHLRNFLERFSAKVKRHLCASVKAMCTRSTQNSRLAKLQEYLDFQVYTGVCLAAQRFYDEVLAFNASMSAREQAYWRAILANVLPNADAMEREVFRQLEPFWQ